MIFSLIRLLRSWLSTPEPPPADKSRVTCVHCNNGTRTREWDMYSRTSRELKHRNYYTKVGRKRVWIHECPSCRAEYTTDEFKDLLNAR